MNGAEPFPQMSRAEMLAYADKLDAEIPTVPASQAQDYWDAANALREAAS